MYNFAPYLVCYIAGVFTIPLVLVTLSALGKLHIILKLETEDEEE